jgi:hypothetical protein
VLAPRQVSNNPPMRSIICDCRISFIIVVPVEIKSEVQKLSPPIFYQPNNIAYDKNRSSKYTHTTGEFIVTDFSVVLFRPHFMLASEEYPMKGHKNQWL